MVQLIAGLVAALVERKAAGAVAGLLASKTQWAATTGSLAGLWPLLPGIAAKDPAAIGNAVLIVLAWIATLWARWRAAKAREVPVIVG